MKKLLKKLRRGNNAEPDEVEGGGGADAQKSKGDGTSSSRALYWVYAFTQWVQTRAKPILRNLDWALVRAGSLILALSFVAASSVSTFAVFAVMMAGEDGEAKGQGGGGPGRIVAGEAKTSDDSGPGAQILQKNILARNLFNSDGELAPEVVPEVDNSQQTSGLDFEGVPCSNEQMPISVLGTIFTGDPFSSFVTVKDAKVSYADTYKVGSLVIDYEDYEVYKVNRDKVEFRKGDQKICVSLNVIGGKSSGGGGPPQPDVPVPVQPENIVNLEFEAEELADGIGPGYANILNSAKLIPALEGGNVIGFKLIAIKPDSLFKKMKFQNRDIITEVNGESLRDASAGFKLYQALQEEREINIRVVRGDTVMTYIVRVK